MLTFVVKKGTMKLSGCLFLENGEKTCIKFRRSLSSSSSKLKLPNKINPGESYLTR